MILPGFPVLIKSKGKAPPFTYNMGFEAADPTTGWSASGGATLKSAGNARTGSNKCRIPIGGSVEYVIPAAAAKGLSINVQGYHRVASATTTLRTIQWSSNQGSGNPGTFTNANTTYSLISFTIPFVPNGVDDITILLMRGASGVDAYFDDFAIIAT